MYAAAEEQRRRRHCATSAHAVNLNGHLTAVALNGRHACGTNTDGRASHPNNGLRQGVDMPTPLHTGTTGRRLVRPPPRFQQQACLRRRQPVECVGSECRQTQRPNAAAPRAHGTQVCRRASHSDFPFARVAQPRGGAKPRAHTSTPTLASSTEQCSAWVHTLAPYDRPTHWAPTPVMSQDPL